jgi:hypothetical protein
MKNSFALALAAASCFSLTFEWQQALAQAATEYLQDPGQAVDQGENLAKTWPKAEGELTPYQIQEKAIQDGLKANPIPAPKVETNYASENNNNNFGNAPKYGGGSRMRGVASMAGRMLARTAQATLPTAGVVLLGTALSRGAMGNMSNMGRRPAFGQSALGGNGMNSGFNQLNGMSNGAMPNYAAMNGYGNAWGNGYGYGSGYYGGR